VTVRSLHFPYLGNPWLTIIASIKTGTTMKTTIATALAALALTGCMTVGSVPTEATRVQ
jgi:hypothetical protein